MGFKQFLKTVVDFVSGENVAEEKTKPKAGIKDLAEQRVKALGGRWEIVEAQVKLAAKSRRELKKLVAEAKAVEALGKRALANGQQQKAEAAMSRYAIMQETIQQLTQQAMNADQEAQNALSGFKTEAAAARRSVQEADALSQLEHVIELQKQQKQLELTYSTAADEFDEAKDQLLLEASVQAATASIQSGEDQLSNEIKAHMKDQQVLQIEAQWKKDLQNAGNQIDADYEVVDDITNQAIDFLDKPAFGGVLGFGEPILREEKPAAPTRPEKEETAETPESAETESPEKNS